MNVVEIYTNRLDIWYLKSFFRSGELLLVRTDLKVRVEVLEKLPMIYFAPTDGVNYTHLISEHFRKGRCKTPFGSLGNAKGGVVPQKLGDFFYSLEFQMLKCLCPPSSL